VQTGTKFTGILEHAAEGVVCQLESAQGTQLVRARFVVDASGHARAVWRAAGLAERPARVGIGAEIECQEASGADGRCVLFVGSAYAPSGYGWIFPAPGGRVRVGVGVQRPDSAASPADLLQHFLGSPEVRRLGLRLGEPVERHFGVIPADGVPPAFACGRLVGVGDAVGQALPLVGEGIRYAIEAGRHLGRGLALALTGAQSHAQVFRAYEAWWKGRYGRPFALAQRLNERMARFSDREWDDALPLLGRFAPDDVARLLRVEIGGRLALRILRLGGWRAARLGVRHWWSGRAATSRDSAGAA
jgi:digeranylgeranylglycerophospholipid reductase